jgi:hypothetical protein
MNVYLLRVFDEQFEYHEQRKWTSKNTSIDAMGSKN